MTSRHDCGPTALLQVLRHRGLPVDRRSLCEAWRFVDHCDRFDTPGHHLRTLRRLGVPYAMRRRLDDAHLAAAFARDLPVTFLIPRGVARWHWIVLCGRHGDMLRASYGDGTIREVCGATLLASARNHLAGRALHVDGLGYVVGDARPFDSDVALERTQLRLAAAAQEWLWPVEVAVGAARSAFGKLGWKKGR